MKDCVICKKPYDGRTNRGIDYCKLCSGLENNNQAQKGGGVLGLKRDVVDDKNVSVDNSVRLHQQKETVSGTSSTIATKVIPERNDDSPSGIDVHVSGTEGGSDIIGDVRSNLTSADVEATTKVDPILVSLEDELEYEELRLKEIVESEKIAKTRAKLLRVRMLTAKAETRRVRYDTLTDKMSPKYDHQLDVRDKVIKAFVQGQDPGKLSNCSKDSSMSSDSVLESESSSEDESALGATGGKPRTKKSVKDKDPVPEVKKVQKSKKKKKIKEESRREKIRKKHKKKRDTSSDSEFSSENESELMLDIQKYLPKEQRKKQMNYKEVVYYSLKNIEYLIREKQAVGPYVGHLRFLAGKDLHSYKYESICRYDSVVRSKAMEEGLEVFGRRDDDDIHENLGSDAILSVRGKGRGGGGYRGMGRGRGGLTMSDLASQRCFRWNDGRCEWGEKCFRLHICSECGSKEHVASRCQSGRGRGVVGGQGGGGMR